MKLALGTVQFGLPYGIANRSGQVGEATAAAILDYAREAGIDTIDTAIGYGESEAVLGRIGVRDFRVITKLPPLPGDVSDIERWVSEQIEGSLDRLRIDRLGGVLLHGPDQLLGEQGAVLADAMRKLRKEGRVAKIGVSIYAPDDLARLQSVMPSDLVQAPFNLIDRCLAATGWLDRLKAEGVEVHVRSVFLQGLLLMAPPARPSRFARWGGLWRRWSDWLAKHPEIDSASACLAFARSFPAIDRIVVGVDGLDQIKTLAAAANAPLPADFPDIACSDEELINPASWSEL